MTRKLYSIPAYSADGREFSLNCLMDDDQLLHMSRLGKIVVRVDFAAEIVAIHPADASLIASLEREAHKDGGGVMQ